MPKRANTLLYRPFGETEVINPVAREWPYFKAQLHVSRRGYLNQFNDFISSPGSPRFSLMALIPSTATGYHGQDFNSMGMFAFRAHDSSSSLVHARFHSACKVARGRRSRALGLPDRVWTFALILRERGMN